MPERVLFDPLIAAPATLPVLLGRTRSVGPRPIPIARMLRRVSSFEDRPGRSSSRSSREAHIPTKQHEAVSKARVPGSDGHPRRASRPAVSPSQGSSQAECVIRSVTARSSFVALRSDGVRFRSGPVSLRFAPVEDEPALAFAIGKKFGTAVERNRARRRMRAAFVESSAHERLPAGAYQLSASRHVLTIDYTRLVDSIDECRRRVIAHVDQRVAS